VLLRPEASTRRSDLPVTVAYAAGTTSGALLSASVLWLLSGFAQPLPPPARVVLLVLAAAAVWAIKMGPWQRIRLPEARRQIPAEVFGGSLTRGAYRFGLELGTGVRTYVPSPAPYILAAALLLTRPTLGATLAAALGFGLGRAAPLLVRVADARRHQVSDAFLRGVEQVAPATAAAIVLLGAVTLV
jgi:hypothetical protein